MNSGGSSPHPPARLTRIVSRTTGGPWRPFRTFALVIALGIAIGVLTVFAQGALPGTWKTWANSGAVWLAPAFFVGSFMSTDRVAAAAGFVALVAAIAGYYVSVPVIVEGASSDVRSVTVWVVAALVGGPVLGMAGHWWRDDRALRRIAALAILGGVFTGEGLERVLADPRIGAAGWTMVAAGILVPLVLGRTIRERLWSLAAEPPVIVATMGAYAILNSAELWS